jgi:hypothetical protein
MVSCFGLQNQAGFSLSVASQNQQRKVKAGHTSRYIGLLHVKNRAIISQSNLKDSGGATAGDIRDIITEIT